MFLWTGRDTALTVQNTKQMKGFVSTRVSQKWSPNSSSFNNALLPTLGQLQIESKVTLRMESEQSLMSSLAKSPECFFIKKLSNSFLKCSMFWGTIPSFTIFLSEAKFLYEMFTCYGLSLYRYTTHKYYIRCFLFQLMFSYIICHTSYSICIKFTRVTLKGAQLQLMRFCFKIKFLFAPHYAPTKFCALLKSI